MPRQRLDALGAVVARLRCPHCEAELSLADATLGCANGHRYDVSRYGYVSLFANGRPPHTGDTASMVSARDAFLTAGHYAPIAEAVAELAAARTCGSVTPTVVDVGAGTGHYLVSVLERLGGAHGIALDASRDALRRAVRANDRIAGVVCDAWRPLPLGDASAGLVLNVFAPRQAAEVARILAPGGELITVTPAPEHLQELIEPLSLLAIRERKQERLREALAPHLEGVGTAHELSFALQLTSADVRSLVAMGPSAHHVEGDALEEAVASLPEPVTATASVVVERFRRS